MAEVDPVSASMELLIAEIARLTEALEFQSALTKNLLPYQDEAVTGRAEIEALRAEVEKLKSMTAVTMGVGRGDGSLFVHGDAGEVDGEALARRFHETYERLAPSFGYETRTETREFDPESANGRLMIAVCAELSQQPEAQAQGGGEVVSACDCGANRDNRWPHHDECSVFAAPPSAPVVAEGFDKWFDEYTKNNYTDEMLAEAAWKAARDAYKSRAEQLTETLREAKSRMLGQVKWVACDCGCEREKPADAVSVAWLRASALLHDRETATVYGCMEQQ